MGNEQPKERSIRELMEENPGRWLVIGIRHFEDHRPDTGVLIFSSEDEGEAARYLVAGIGPLMFVRGWRPYHLNRSGGGANPRVKGGSNATHASRAGPPTRNPPPHDSFVFLNLFQDPVGYTDIQGILKRVQNDNYLYCHSRP